MKVCDDVTLDELIGCVDQINEQLYDVFDDAFASTELSVVVVPYSVVFVTFAGFTIYNNDNDERPYIGDTDELVPIYSYLCNEVQRICDLFGKVKLV